MRYFISKPETDYARSEFLHCDDGALFEDAVSSFVKWVGNEVATKIANGAMDLSFLPLTEWALICKKFKNHPLFANKWVCALENYLADHENPDNFIATTIGNLSFDDAISILERVQFTVFLAYGYGVPVGETTPYAIALNSGEHRGILRKPLIKKFLNELFACLAYTAQSSLMWQASNSVEEKRA